MKKIFSIFKIQIIIVLLAFVACESNEDVLVGTLSVVNEQATTSYNYATLMCELQSNASIEEVYLHYATTSSFADEQTVAMTLQEDGSYLAMVESLLAGTTYHVRYEAANRYSSLKTKHTSTFQTVKYGVPVLPLPTANKVDYTAAVIAAEVTDDGGQTIIERGVCFDTQALPTIEARVVKAGEGLGAFTCEITDLEMGVTYFVRAYAKNSVGISYSQAISFTTLTTLPQLITTEPTNVSMFSALVGGDVQKDNGYAITMRGVCYSTSENPTISDNYVVRGSALGQYLCELTNLQAQTVYYARAFATNANGTSYGNQVSFTTLQAPEVFTLSAQAVTSHSALVGGGYTSDGGTNITACGICYSFTHYPTIDDMCVAHAVSSSFECELSDLRPGTVFYARAYVTNEYGTAYGNEITFTTLTNIPVVNTLGITNQTASTVDVQAMVVSDGGFAVTKRGVCYSTNPQPTIADNIVTNDVGIGSYTCTISKLQAGTTYYVRAFATNSEGTGYGEIKEVKM